MKFRHRAPPDCLRGRILQLGDVRRPRVHRGNHALQRLGTAFELGDLTFVERLERESQFFDTPGATGGEDLPSFVGGFDQRQTAVAQVAFTRDQSVPLEARHDACHCRRPDLLGAGERTEGEWATEYHYRQSRQARGRKSAGVVFLSQVPQQVDRGRVESVRQSRRFGSRRQVSATSLMNCTTFPCPSDTAEIQISRPFIRAMTRGSSMTLAPADLILA